jgi:hypothetical protein
MNNEIHRSLNTKLLEQYPLYLPPDDLAEKGHLNWNKKELKRYFEWFMDNYNLRVDFFLDFFKMTYSKDPDIIFSNGFPEMIFNLFDKNPLLTTIKKRNVPLDAKPDIKFLIENDAPRQEFTNLGYAIAGDSGLLIAKVVLDNRTDLSLGIPTKGGKSYVHYNKVVIRQNNDSFGSSEWDPIGLGIGNIGYPINVSRKPYDYPKSIKEMIIR